MFQDEQLNSIIEDGVIPTFKVVPMLNQFKTKAAGHPEYDNVEMVHIRVPGDPKTEVVEPVSQVHKDRFPRSWEAFEKKTEMKGGTPLESLPDLDPASVAKIKSMNIFSVEQLASIHDGLLANLGAQGRQLREKAKEFTSKREDSHLVDTVSKQEEEIQKLKAQIAAMSAPAGEQEEPRKPGRPKLTIPPHMQAE